MDEKYRISESCYLEFDCGICYVKDDSTQKTIKEFTGNEHTVLKLLFDKKNNVVTYNSISKALWPDGDYWPDNEMGGVRNYISKVRVCLKSLGAKKDIIKNIAETGYIFNMEKSLDSNYQEENLDSIEGGEVFTSASTHSNVASKKFISNVQIPSQATEKASISYELNIAIKQAIEAKDELVQAIKSEQIEGLRKDFYMAINAINKIIDDIYGFGLNELEIMGFTLEHYSIKLRNLSDDSLSQYLLCCLERAGTHALIALCIAKIKDSAEALDRESQKKILKDLLNRIDHLYAKSGEELIDNEEHLTKGL